MFWICVKTTLPILAMIIWIYQTKKINILSEADLNTTINILFGIILIAVGNIIPVSGFSFLFLLLNIVVGITAASRIGFCIWCLLKNVESPDPPDHNIDG